MNIYIAALIRKLDALWRKAIKLRDGCCVICRSRDALEAHHSIIRRRAFATRWAMHNGLTLCWKCHAAVHAGKLKEALQAALDRLCSRVVQEDIYRSGHMILQPGQDWMESRVAELKATIKSYKKEP